MPRNYLEACCLGEDSELRAPLEAAAIGLWPALVRTLVENGASPWAKKYWINKKENDSRHNPYFTFIITDLLTADHKTSDLKRRLQGARWLLTKTTDMRDRLCPKTVDDLHALLVTSNRMLQADYCDAHEEITALWSQLHEVFRVLPNLPRDRTLKRRYHHDLTFSARKSSVRLDYQNRGIVYVAAKQRNTSALECLLSLGFSVDGSFWNRLTLTPYDTVRGRTSCRDASDEAQCMRMLQERGAHPGLFYSVEFEILLTVLGLYLLVCLVMYDIPLFIWMMKAIPRFFEFLANIWQAIREYVTSGWPSVLLIMLATIALIALLSNGVVMTAAPIFILGGYIVFVILSFGRIAPKLFLKPDKCPWWVTTESSTAVLLHIIPWVWLLTNEMHGGDVELVRHFLYGPTVTIIRSLNHRYRSYAQQGPVVVSEETTEADPMAGEIDIHVDSNVQHSRPSRRLRGETFTELINASFHSIISLPRTVAALAHGKRLMLDQGKLRSSYQGNYRDDDYDEEELSLLMRSEENDDDVVDLA